MCICESCGFVTYPDRLDKETLSDFYEEEYRRPPTWANLCSGERKIHYHAAFLSEQFDKWRKEEKKPRILEIGSAFGMFLQWCKKALPDCEVYGTELTTSFVRNAWHIYKIKLDKDFDESLKYDMICSYKVAEHQIDADLELERYRKCLKDDGLLYISVPCWFQNMENFGSAGFSLQEYYHPNHINTWTRAHFENLLSRKGFKVIKSDHVFYNETYLCEKAEPTTEVHKEDPEVIRDKLDRFKKAADAYMLGDYAKALEHYPAYPMAHAGNYEINRAKFDKQGWEFIHEKVLKPAIAACPRSVEPVMLATDVCLRYNKWEDALGYAQEALKMRPNAVKALLSVSNALRGLAEQTKVEGDKVKFLQESADCLKYLQSVSMQTKADSTTWMMFDNAKIPTPHE
jgi:SAM-dependent methyltransferase